MKRITPSPVCHVLLHSAGPSLGVGGGFVPVKRSMLGTATSEVRFTASAVRVTPLSLAAMRRGGAVAVVTIGTLAAVAYVVHVWRRRASRIIAAYKARVYDRPWYRQVVVTEQRHGSFGVQRSLHLGSHKNVPESIVRLELVSGEWRPVASALLKPHLQHSLLAFAFLPAEGFPANSRAALVGCAAGSLLHFWRECVPGGTSLRVDAVEIDGAVLEAARTHFGLATCEAEACGSPGVTFHVADGAAFLREAEDEVYSLLMIDLDMGALVNATASSGGDADNQRGAATTARARLQQADPTRDMYRSLDEDGVLVINEYSEDPPAKRLESSLRLIRLLRRFFAEVHMLRTNTNHNVMLIAPVQRTESSDIQSLAELAGRSSAHLGKGGIDLAALVRMMPPNRYQVFSGSD